MKYIILTRIYFLKIVWKKSFTRLGCTTSNATTVWHTKSTLRKLELLTVY